MKGPLWPLEASFEQMLLTKISTSEEIVVNLVSQFAQLQINLNAIFCKLDIEVRNAKIQIDSVEAVSIFRVFERERHKMQSK